MTDETNTVGSEDSMPEAERLDDAAEAIMTEPNGDDGHDELTRLRAEAAANLEGWQRARAEFANYKKRVDKQMSESYDRATLDVLARVLPIMDDFDRALANVPDDLREHPWLSGTALIMRKFEKLLEENNVETIDPVGEDFDPRRHEAVGMDENSEYPSGKVTITLQKGYLSGEHILRPALVRVAT